MAIANHIRLILLIHLFCIPITAELSAQSIDRLNIPFYMNGQQIMNPLTGGLLAPQFSSVDLNLDGKLDILVFDRIGDVLLPYLNEAESDELNFVFAPQYINVFPETKIWILMRDYNQDNIYDVFKSPSIPGIPGIEVWKGSINEGKLEYNLVTNDEYDFNVLYIPISNGFTQIYVSIIDIPAIDDVDGDGDLDVLSFEPGGTKVTYYRNTSMDNEGTLENLSFVLSDNCYGKFQENGFSAEVILSPEQNQCARFILDEPEIELRHSGSTIAAFDENGDGLVELLLGDLASSSLVLLRNEGLPGSAWFTSQDIQFPSYDVPVDIEIFVSSFILDVNNDQRKDLIAAPNDFNVLQNKDHIWLYMNDGTETNPSFSIAEKDFLIGDMLHFGTQANPCFIDYNQDGLYDILVGTQGFRNEIGQFISKLYLFQNTGTEVSPEYTLLDDDYLQFSSYANSSTNFAPAVGDLDGDQDLDMVIGDGQGYLYYLENTGGPGNPFSFAEPVYKFQDIKVGQQVKPFIFDFNEDGLGDLIIGERNFNSLEEEIGSFNFLQNEGEIGNPSFTSVENEPNNELFGMIDLKEQGYINNYSSPYVVNTGEDFLLFTGSESGKIHVYDSIKANIDGQFNEVYADLGIREGIRTVLAAADINHDGFLELLVGNMRGGLALYGTDILSGDEISNTEEEDISNLVNVFPNPVSNELQIEFSSELHDVNLEIWNLNGQCVRKLIPLSNQLKIQFSEQAAGIYILRIQSKKFLLFRKVIKI